MIVSFGYIVSAQSTAPLPGARAHSLGYSSACLADEWSVLNNVAGLAKVKDVSVGFTYDMQPSFMPFDKVAFALCRPGKISIGLGFFRFGDNLYQEQILSGGAGSAIGTTAIGLKVNYIRYSVSGIGDKGILSISLGGISELTPRLTVGAHIINVNQPFLSKADDERLPTLLIVGLMFKLRDNAFVVTELEKDMEFKAVWKSGLEYTLHKKLLIRTGFNLYPSAGFFGLGFRLRKFNADYAFQYSAGWGSRHEATVVYRLKTSMR